MNIQPITVTLSEKASTRRDMQGDIQKHIHINTYILDGSGHLVRWEEHVS